MSQRTKYKQWKLHFNILAGKYILMSGWLRKDNWRKKASEAKEKTALYFSALYLACLSFYLSMSVRRVYIGNTKSFPQGPHLRKCFQKCTYNTEFRPFVLMILIHLPFYPQIITGHECESSYIVYKPGILVPPLLFIMTDEGKL